MRSIWLGLLVGAGLVAQLGACTPNATNGSQPRPRVAQGGQVIVTNSAELGRQLDAVEAVRSPIGGSVVVMLPETWTGLNEILKPRIEAEVEAIKKARIFDRVDVASAASPETTTRDSCCDYVLWREGNTWLTSYKGGPRGFLYTSKEGLADWAKKAPSGFLQARKAVEERQNAMGVLNVGGKHYFSFRGQEFVTASDLERFMLNSLADDGRRVPTVSGPLAGQARIILASHSGRGLPNLAADIRQAQSSFNRALAIGKAEAIKSSRMFQSVSISVRDVLDVPSDTHDVTIWELANGKGWMMRVRGGDARYLKQPSDLGAWVAGIESEVRNAQAAIKDAPATTVPAEYRPAPKNSIGL